MHLLCTATCLLIAAFRSCCAHDIIFWLDAPASLASCCCMQTLALDRNVRVTFLGGDVHAGAVGRLYTQPKLQRLRYDHRMMVQVGPAGGIGLGSH